MGLMRPPDRKTRQQVSWIKPRRRRPAAGYAVVLLGLVMIGLGYAAITAGGAASAATPGSPSPGTIAEGRSLFQTSCATCHGMDAQGTAQAPSLIGAGAAAVDFQVSTGRMPMQQAGAQVIKKRNVYSQTEIRQMGAYIASLGPGPAIPTKDQYDPSGLSTDEISRGGEFFRTNCTACHNFAGRGGAMPQGKFAPNLTKTSPKHIFEAMLTGPQQMPVFSDQVLTPQDKKEIIGYIKQLNSQTEYGGFSLGSLGPVSEGMFAWLVGIGGLIIVAIWIAAHTAKSKKKAEADA
jgi:ubiquinol-cytochrome c reductase cytochrome c subunit